MRDTSSRDKMLDVGLLLIRGIVGAVFIFHGSQKLFGWFDGMGLDAFSDMLGTKMGLPYPRANAIAASSAEFCGGVLLVLGLATRLAVIPLIITMAVAVYKVHWGAFALPAGMEYALTLGIISLGLGFTGAGRISFDEMIWGRRGEESPAARRESRLE